MSEHIQSWWQSPYRTEPSLAEMISDPIVHLVMARDNVCQEDVRNLFREMAVRMKAA
jgi:hypothetical protein